jgi:hypothetical protein
MEICFWMTPVFLHRPSCGVEQLCLPAIFAYFPPCFWLSNFMRQIGFVQKEVTPR